MSRQSRTGRLRKRLSDSGRVGVPYLPLRATRFYLDGTLVVPLPSLPAPAEALQHLGKEIDSSKFLRNSAVPYFP